MDVKEIIELFGKLAGERTTIESHWQELAERFLPIKANITSIRTPGSKLKTTNYDGTAMESLLIFAAGLHSYLTNPSSRWFELGVDDEEAKKDKEVKEWLQACQTRIFLAFNNSNFNQQIHETYIDFGCFGTACLYEEEDPLQKVRFYARPVAECHIMENEREIVDVNIRKCKYTVRQAYLKWGDRSGEVILDKVKAGKWTDEVVVIHSTMPRFKREEGKQDSKNKPFESKYIEKSKKHLLGESGYDEFPYFVPRQVKVSGEVWGYSQSMVALPDVKTLNTMSKTTLKAAQKMVDPPIVVPDDGYILPLKTTAGAVNMKNADAKAEIEILQSEVKGNFPISLEMQEQRRQQIRRAMFVDLFLTLAKLDKEMTAKEVVERVNEKMLILGPILGRLMHELLDPLIHRTFAILMRAGSLPPIPAALKNEDGSTKDYSVVYISPLAKAQRLAEAKSINDFIITVSGVNAIASTAVDNINVDAVVKRLADIYNIPADLLNSDDTIKQIRDGRAKAAELEKQLELLKLGGEGMEKITKAGKNARGEEKKGGTT